MNEQKNETQNAQTSKQDLEAIVKTAATVVDVAGNAQVPYLKEILEILKVEYGEIKSFAPSVAAIPASRYLTSHAILEDYVEKYKTDLQVIELGAGFTSHALNLQGKVSTYVEVDLPINSDIKQRVIQKINPEDKTKYVGGNVLEESTWKQIAEHIDPAKPTIIFSEGLLLYFDSKQRDTLAELAKGILKNSKDGTFVFEDSFVNHPEMMEEPLVKDGIKNIIERSKTTVYGYFTTEAANTEAWKNRGFSQIERVNYKPIESQPEFSDRIISKMRSYVCKL